MAELVTSPTIVYTDPALKRRYEGRKIPMNTFFEAFIAQKLDVTGDLHQLMRQRDAFMNYRLTMEQVRFLVQDFIPSLIFHTKKADRKFVTEHYDRGNDFFHHFLGETMVYTSAFFESKEDTLEAAQLRKIRHVAEKIHLKKGERLLDIGCGWGGLIIHAAQQYGVRAHGVSPAPNQVEAARARAKALGLESRVTAEVADFREVKGIYDKISSVGMFEHLYPHEHATFFSRINNLLTADGIGLLHFMGCTTDKNDPDPFIQTYIYPGSTHPQLSLALKGLEREKLAVLDVENIARHYLPTAQHWHDRFHANKHRLDPTQYDARFIRMFEYLMAIYIAGCTALVSGVFQVLYTKNFRKNLPWWRV